MSASPKTSGKPAENQPQNILEAIQLHSLEFPESTEWYVGGEHEAGLILLSMAAALKHVMEGHPDRDSRAKIKSVGQSYRLAVVRGKAFEFLDKLTQAEGGVELFGLRLICKRITPA